jgi:DNA processing protein
MEDKLWIALSLIKGIGIKKLLKINQTSFSLTELDYMTIKNITKVDITQALIEEKLKETDELIKKHSNEGIEIISYSNPLYPKMLRDIHSPPSMLFCKGNLDLLNSFKMIAVIGSRDTTEMGLRVARKISNSFSKRNYIIVSGLALGIDSAAHLGAIDNKEKTIAVLPSDLKDIYPNANNSLANSIIENNGLLVSEYPIGSPLLKSNFVNRNRIQSGISLGVCVVQTDIKGGTMETVKHAKREGKFIFCPKPLEETNIKQYRGIRELMNEKTVVMLNDYNDYEKIDHMLSEKLNEFLERK